MIEIFDENRFDKFRIVDMQSWLHSHETSVQIPILFYFFSAEFPKILLPYPPRGSNERNGFWARNSLVRKGFEGRCPILIEEVKCRYDEKNPCQWID